VCHDGYTFWQRQGHPSTLRLRGELPGERLVEETIRERSTSINRSGDCWQRVALYALLVLHKPEMMMMTMMMYQ